MKEETLPQHAELSFVESAFAWFMRLLAIYCLILAVSYWIRLIGLHTGSLWRFDLMPGHWQTASISLAVLFPVAAIGLWMRAPWGPVLWFVAGLIESTIYTFFASLFEARPMIAIINLMILISYVSCRIVLWQQTRLRTKS